MSAVSLRAYARHRGVSHTAVEKAVKQGRIQADAVGKIDIEQADRDWDRNSNPVNAKPAVVREAKREIAATEPIASGPSYAQSRAIREAYEARLSKLTYEERTRKLINADEMRVAAFNLARMIHDRVLNVPDRIAGVVLADRRAALRAVRDRPGRCTGVALSR